MTLASYALSRAADMVLDPVFGLHFCTDTFGVRRTNDGLDTENQSVSGQIRPGSGALWLSEKVWHQKYDTKKGCQNYLKYSINRIFKKLVVPDRIRF